MGIWICLMKRKAGWGCGFIDVERWAAIGGRCEPRISDVDGLDGFGCAPPFQRKNKTVIDADR